MNPEPPSLARTRFGAWALAGAWLLVVAGLAGLAGYLLVMPAEPTAKSETGIEIALPASGPKPAAPPVATAEQLPAAAPVAEPVAEASAKPPEAAPQTAALPPAGPEPAAPPVATAEQLPAAAPVAEPVAEASAEPPEAAPQTAALPPPAEQPWRRFSQPFAGDAERPRVAIVLTGLGLSSAMTEAAIRELPAAVTLSFTPYGRDLARWIDEARAFGHEVLLDLPMEPTSYPDDDPGPQALLTTLSETQNLARLDWILGRAEGYVGVAVMMGSRFVASREDLEPILEALKTRGLLLLDNRSSDATLAWALARAKDLPAAINDRTLDSGDATKITIEERLRQLERIATTEHHAVAMGRPFPATIDSLAAWLRGLDDRKLVLAPLTALANRQPLDKALEQGAQSQ